MSANANSHPYSNLTNCDTNNATRIGWQDWDNYDYWPADYLLSRKKDYYKQLDRINSGYQNGPEWQNKSYETYKLNRGLARNLGERLRMDWWEIKRAIKLFDGLQRSYMGLLSEVVAFSTCAYVVHQFNDRRQCHPQTKEEDRDYFFEKVREDFEISDSQFQSVFGKVSHKIRNEELNFQRFDHYGVDSDAEQSWRTLSEGDEKWL